MQVTSIHIVLWTSAWAAMGWLIGHYLSISREFVFPRKRFKSFVEVLIVEIKSIQTEELGGSRSRSIPGFQEFSDCEKQISEVRPYIRRRMIAQFDDACAAFRRAGVVNGNAKDCEEAKERLVSTLNQLLDCAK
jgi:hypothetical protein